MSTGRECPKSEKFSVDTQKNFKYGTQPLTPTVVSHDPPFHTIVHKTIMSDKKFTTLSFKIEHVNVPTTTGIVQLGEPTVQFASIGERNVSQDVLDYRNPRWFYL